MTDVYRQEFLKTSSFHKANSETPEKSMVKACLNVFLTFQPEDMIEF